MICTHVLRGAPRIRRVQYNSLVQGQVEGDEGGDEGQGLQVRELGQAVGLHNDVHTQGHRHHRHRSQHLPNMQANITFA